MLKWLDENLEEFLMVALLIAMTVIMGIQVFARYALGASLSWSEELTRYLFIWSGFISVSYCTKKCISIKIEQFVAIVQSGEPHDRTCLVFISDSICSSLSKECI